MSSEKKIKIGFVGVGNMGQCAHLRNYVKLPECEVTAIAEIKPKTAEMVARRYGIPRVYKDHTDLLAHEKVDALVVSQPFTRHGILLKERLPAKLPIFIEKPLAGSIEKAEEILEIVRANKGRLMIGYHKRSDPAAAYARQAIEKFKASGEVGKLKYVRITMPPGDWIQHGFDEIIPKHPDDALPTLERDPPPADMPESLYKQYLNFVNYYIHQVNFMRFALGEPYQVAYADPSGVVMAGQSRSGVPCVIEMNSYSTTVDWQEHIFAGFEKGYVSITLPAPLALNRAGTVEVLTDPGNGATPIVTRPHLPWVHAMRQQALNFIKFARGDAPATCEAAEALDDLRVARDYIRLLTGK